MSESNLVAALQNCRTLLQDVGETFWSEKIGLLLEKNEGQLSAHDARNVSSWFGGMGSFNDLMISAANDHKVNFADEDRLNDELGRLRDTIYVEVNKLVVATDKSPSDYWDS